MTEPYNIPDRAREPRFSEFPTPTEYTDTIFKIYPMYNITLNALGLCAEAGEFANFVKKKSYITVSDEVLIDELADTMWHIAQCARLLNSSIEELMAISMNKTLNRNIDLDAATKMEIEMIEKRIKMYTKNSERLQKEIGILRGGNGKRL